MCSRDGGLWGLKGEESPCQRATQRDETGLDRLTGQLFYVRRFPAAGLCPGFGFITTALQSQTFLWFSKLADARSGDRHRPVSLRPLLIRCNFMTNIAAFLLATHRVWQQQLGLPAGGRGPRLSQSAQPAGGQRPQGPSAHLPHRRTSDRGEEECSS